MTATAGVFSENPGAQAWTGRAAPMAAASGSGSNGSGGASAGSATISANDFLTLLVTEMQNQDPTAQTDPNEYVNQLVAVNSLEQLIGINQTLTTDLGTPASTSNASTPAAEAGSVHTAAPMAAASGGAKTLAHPVAQTVLAPGNLSVPAANPAAQRVAHALDGRKASVPSPAMPAKL